MLREELRIHQARMAQLPPHRRPYYPPAERMAILQLRAARNWSLEQAAKAFLVTAETIASWLKRVDEQGPDALIQLPEPVNKYPDFVRYAVQRLKSLCPTLGKMKIAQILARAGLHLGVTTVGCILKEKPAHQPTAAQAPEVRKRVVTSKYPKHVWLADLTTLPIGSGFWASWLPFTLPQCWPFGYWVAVSMDHYSRRVMGTALFKRQPTSAAVRAFLGRVMHANNSWPKHLISDRGSPFDCEGFRKWCQKKGIQPRYGAVGRHGSIAVIERLILTLKQNIAWLPLVPLRRQAFFRELACVAYWYNLDRPHMAHSNSFASPLLQQRPGNSRLAGLDCCRIIGMSHMSLGGRTPDEIYHRFPAGNRQPRFEPRPQWPRRSPCARPVTLVKGKPGVRLVLEVACPAGRGHLPILTLKRAA